MPAKYVRTRITSLIFGVLLPVQALRLILKTRRLLLWSLLPIVLTLALSVWGVSWMKQEITQWGIHWLGGFGYDAHSITVQAAMAFLQILLFVLAAILFSLFAGIIAAPFNDFLAEAAEPFTRPALPPPPAHALSARGRLRAVAIDIVKTLVITSIQVGLLIIGIIAFWLPGLNLVPFAAAFWLLTFQFISYPQTRRGEGILAAVRFLWEHPFSSFGFGASLGFLFAIPILSSFALPLAVVGGTLLYARAADPGCQ